jgi:ribose 5-phosphate isomerase
MATNTRHFKYINSKTGNTIYHYTVTRVTDPEKLKQELESVRNKVASDNGVFMETIYWEEITEKTE